MNSIHLTFDDRLAIQAGLQQGLKVARIAKNIGKDPSVESVSARLHVEVVIRTARSIRRNSA